jgi:hypothetical protein
LKKNKEKKMSKNLMPYYISRGVLSIFLAGLLYFSGTPLWTAIVIGAIILLLFLLAPLSGRYTVRPEFGITALRRDDFTNSVNDKAGRNGFVASMLVTASAAGYSSIYGGGLVTSRALMLIVLAGVLVYSISDYFYRRV